MDNLIRSNACCRIIQKLFPLQILRKNIFDHNKKSVSKYMDTFKLDSKDVY